MGLTGSERGSEGGFESGSERGSGSKLRLSQEVHLLVLLVS